MKASQSEKRGVSGKIKCEMAVRPIMGLVLFFVAIAGIAQDNVKPKLSLTVLLPEPPATGTCDNSYAGYLEIKGSRFPTKEQIGEWVVVGLQEGYSIALHPLVSGKTFVELTCNQGKDRRRH
jgi:hypothetical protein